MCVFRLGIHQWQALLSQVLDTIRTGLHDD
jgi:hypothetical protein